MGISIVLSVYINFITYNLQGYLIQRVKIWPYSVKLASNFSKQEEWPFRTKISSPKLFILVSYQSTFYKIKKKKHKGYFGSFEAIFIISHTWWLFFQSEYFGLLAQIFPMCIWEYSILRKVVHYLFSFSFSENRGFLKREDMRKKTSLKNI